MTTNRLLILIAFLMVGMGMVFVLPASPKSQPSGVDLQLPSLVGGWAGRDAAVTEKEHQVLGPETEFSRKTYTNVAGDQLFVSVVLSGQDMNTSIHRPERCLSAQGWAILDSHVVSIPLADGASLHATRLHDVRPVKMENGATADLYNLNYYWFVGFSDITASHMTRTFYDIRDRLLKGYNQRWAYVTVVANVTKNFKEGGRTERETDELIRDFIKQLAPLILRPSVKLG